MKKKAKVIAFYLPQFHPTTENDEWWGKGFTEWTNVGKAKPLFKGHYQPRVPADLGYYDLRLPEIREAQVELAKEAGVDGFCYWHYWFGNGKRLLERPFDEVLNSGKPDFPFCLGWANHSWYAKLWNANDTSKDKLLVEQVYPGEADIRAHFDYVIKAFKDERYIKVGNKPFFLIFDAINLPANFIELWNKWAKEEGFEDGIYFVANVTRYVVKSKDEILAKGFDAVTFQRNREFYMNKTKVSKAFFRLKAQFKKVFFNKPIFTFNYKEVIPSYLTEEEKAEDVLPFMVPNWDHSPRSGIKGMVIVNSTPELFKQHAKQVLDVVAEKENNIVLLKSWNEWAEGNYMEPDLKFGKGYIKALREVLDNK